MISPQANFRAGWRLRSETVEGAARQILSMLVGFPKCIPELREWSFEPPPFMPAPMTVDYISQRLERSAKRLKRPQLGYSLSAWSGTKERTFGLDIIVGHTSRSLPSNRINLRLPIGVWPSDATVRCLFSALVRVWHPEFVAYNPIYPKKERRFELGEVVFLTSDIEMHLRQVAMRPVKREAFESGHLLYIDPAEIDRIYRQTAFLTDQGGQAASPTQ